jgi:hypothetical protein
VCCTGRPAADAVLTASRPIARRFSADALVSARAVSADHDH